MPTLHYKPKPTLVETGVEHRQEAEAALAKRESQAVELRRKLQALEEQLQLRQGQIEDRELRMYEFEKIGVKVAVFRTLAPAFAWKRYRVRRRLAVASDRER